MPMFFVFLKVMLHISVHFHINGHLVNCLNSFLWRVHKLWCAITDFCSSSFLSPTVKITPSNLQNTKQSAMWIPDPEKLYHRNSYYFFMQQNQYFIFWNMRHTIVTLLPRQFNVGEPLFTLV